MTYIPPLNGGRINATIGGNTAGAGALVSTGTMALAGGNNITLSQNGNTITISGGAGGVFSAGLSTIGNTSGTTGLASNQIVFAGGNNITLSQSTAAGGNTLSISAANQTNQTVGLYALGNTTQNSSTTLDARTLNFNGLGAATVGYSNGSVQLSVPTQTAQTQSNLQALYDGANSISTGTVRLSNANGVSFGINGQTLTASHNAITSQSNQTVGLYALGNTTQNSSTTLDARSLSFNGLGAATMGYSNGSIQVSVPTQTAQTQSNIQAIYDGANSITTGTIRFSNSNGVSFGINGQTLTASVNAGAGGGIALANSQTTYTSGTANLVEGGGAITIASTTGQSFKVSVPATSSLSGTGLVSISTNGSTISIGVAANTIDFYQNMDRGTSGLLNVPYNSLLLQRLNQENDEFAAYITANTVLLNMSGSGSSNSSSSHTISALLGIYQDNTSALNLVNSASTTWAMSANTNNSLSYLGARWLSIVSSQWSTTPAFVQGSEYVFGVLFKSSNLSIPLSYIGQAYMGSSTRSGTLGAASNSNVTLAHGNYWNAVYATSTTALPSAISSTQVSRNGTSANFMPHIILNNRYSGTF